MQAKRVGRAGCTWRAVEENHLLIVHLGGDCTARKSVVKMPNSGKSFDSETVQIQQGAVWRSFIFLARTYD